MTGVFDINLKVKHMCYAKQVQYVATDWTRNSPASVRFDLTTSWTGGGNFVPESPATWEPNFPTIPATFLLVVK